MMPSEPTTLGMELFRLLRRWGIRGAVIAVRADYNDGYAEGGWGWLEADELIFDQDGLNVAFDADTGQPIATTTRVPLNAIPVRRG